MKRILALTLAVLMIAALLCACGEKKKSDEAEKKVTVSVDTKYDDGFAEQYAKSVTTDDNGNKVYELDADTYDNYTRDYNNKISKDMSKELADSHEKAYGQFCYINDDKKAVVVGLNPGEYDEKTAKNEADMISKDAFAYFKGLETPVDQISVIFCNANDQQEVYGEFSYDIP